VTYPNACEAAKAGADVRSEGACVADLCSDSDGGKDIFEKGTATDADGSLADKCKDPFQVDEAYCSGRTTASEILPCPGGYACTAGECVKSPCQDSDGGKSKDVKGTTTARGNSSSDECSGTAGVKEYYCDDDDIAYEEMQCGSGMRCTNGACVEAACSDSDGGKDALSKGTTTKGTDSYADSCSGTSAVKEYYCSGNVVESETIQCQSGYSCTDGRCVREICTDSDGGKDQFTKGTTKYGNSSLTDNCYSSTAVLEYFCASETSVQNEKINCGSGNECFDGRCREVECEENTTDLDETDERHQIASFDDADELVLHVGEAVEVNDGLFLKLQSVSGNSTTFRLYENYADFSDGDQLCSVTIAAGDSEDDICSENSGTVEVLSVNDSTDSAELSIEEYYAVEIYSLVGTRTDWTDDPICPDDEEEYDSFTAAFYPYLDTAASGLDLEGKKFTLFDTLAIINEITDTSITIELDGDDYELEDGDEFEYKGQDYEATLDFNDGGLFKFEADPA
jgi:hypothetical protein